MRRLLAMNLVATLLVVLHLLDTVNGSDRADICYGQICGHTSHPPRSTDRIAGGQFVNSNSYPWQCYLSINEKSCGCVIISEFWVLTAAYCLVDMSSGHPVELSREQVVRNADVVVGALNIVKERNKISNTDGAVVKINMYYVHEQTYYQQNNRGVKYGDNDIALLRLNEPLVFDDKIQPICLQTSVMGDGEDCKISGWGPASPGDVPSSILHDLNVPLIGIRRCRWSWKKPIVKPPNYRDLPVTERLTNNMVCGGFKEDKGACEGDFGGPLQCLKDNRWQLVGIASGASANDGCGQGVPGIYTRVHNYKKWITSKTGLRCQQ